MLTRKLSFFGTSMLLAAAIAFTFVANTPLGATSQAGSGNRWVEISRGEIQQGVEFDDQGVVWLHVGASRIQVASLQPYYQTVAISPSDPDRRFAIVVAYGDEERTAWLVDNLAESVRKLPLPDAVGEFASWSPAGTYVVLHTSASEGREALWVLQPDNFTLREVGRKTLKAGVNSCCGLDDWDSGKNQEARVDQDSIRWLDAESFSFRLYTRCDPFAERGCLNDYELAAFLVTVNTATGEVTDQIVAPRNRTPPGRP